MPPGEKPYLACPTAAGSRSIFEAAAGTGKTYNITRIVARLIMERKNVSIKNMVIVTFTRAAAAELKNRISTLLGDLYRRLDPKKTDDELKRELESSRDEDAELLLKALEPESATVALVKEQLRGALLNFDQAIIGTIHSFALRVLTENGFGSGMKMDFTLNEKTDPIISGLCNDYFRSLLFKYKGKKERELLENCGLNICDCARARNDGQLNRKVPGTKVICDCVRARLSSPEIIEEIPGARQFGSVDEAVRTALALPDGADTTAAYAGVLAAVCDEAYSSVKGKFEELAEKNNFLSQDDLILRLRDALKEESFRKILRGKYHIGLIDEFQDTSAAQFDIFESLFLDNEDSTFIVVGDPRQAIYRFRNCDLATYLMAKKKIGTDPIQMNTNYRSGKKYIDVLNDIFSMPGAFALDKTVMPTQYAPDPDPPGTMEPQVLWDSSRNEVAHPIQVVRAQQELDAMLKRCAEDIAAMLDAGYRIPPTRKKDGTIEPDRPLESGDIAVLIAKWRSARLLRDELLERNVPAVALRGENIFGTPEAEELLRFLEGVLDPEHGDARLRALITPLGDLEDLSELKDEKKTAAGISRLQKLGEVWRNRSFGVMYGELLREFRVCDRLNTLDGRRKIGKYNILADYLAEAEFTRKLSPGALCRELWSCIEFPDHAPELSVPPETDRGAVVIDTVFGSKGLSYPVVFLPDLFHRGKALPVPCRCHVGAVEHLIPYQPGERRPPETKKFILREVDEEIQESLRKAYVAFTRARYYCRFYYGCPGRNEPRGNALDWLFRHWLRKPGEDPYAAKRRKPREFSSSDLAAQMKGKDFLPEPVFGKVGVIGDLPEKNREERRVSLEPLRRPDLLPRIDFSRGFLSFSNLAEIDPEEKKRFIPEKVDEPDSDGEGGTASGPGPGKTPGLVLDEEMEALLSFRGGTPFGNAVHKMLERADFKADRERLAREAVPILDAFGFDGAKIGKAVGGLLWRTLNSPIPDGRGGSFLLSEVAPDRKQNEFEFLCEFTRSFDAADLFNAVNTYFAKLPGGAAAAFPARGERFSRGFFNGAIDLFFEHGSRYYIVDWKTNRLDDIGSYTGEALTTVMGKSGYSLQYLIYTAALFKYLKMRRRVPEEEWERFYDAHFGGVRYLFVRGMAPELPGSGVFGDLPPYSICKEVEDIIG